ncbi:hypothetical protein AGMMS50276_21610 [Synergistales bacterium]|nr:hypothetical protein AGMMS50276_21610 [Synergistales bacterium]
MFDTIFASDLDNTLIYSYKVKTEGDICVEQRGGKELSFMSVASFNLLQEVNRKCLFLPVTTRSVEQYTRVALLSGGGPEFAIVSNGGNLLRNGAIDKAWQDETYAAIDGCALKMNQYIALLREDEKINFDIRLIDGMFIFTKSSDIDATAALLRGAVDERFDLLTTNDKLYIIPKVINKGAAVARFRKMFPCERVFCAGDRDMDLSMLLYSDLAFVPSDYNFHSCNFNFHKGPPTSFGLFVLANVLKLL